MIAFQRVKYQSAQYYSLLQQGWHLVDCDKGHAVLTKRI